MSSVPVVYIAFNPNCFENINSFPTFFNQKLYQSCKELLCYRFLVPFPRKGRKPPKQNRGPTTAWAVTEDRAAALCAGDAKSAALALLRARRLVPQRMGKAVAWACLGRGVCLFQVFKGGWKWVFVGVFLMHVFGGDVLDFFDFFFFKIAWFEVFFMHKVCLKWLCFSLGRFFCFGLFQFGWAVSNSCI